MVEHRGANGFLDVARAYGPIEFLSRFHTLADQLPMHARANLPGKTLFFHVLLAITGSSDVMGLLIVLASTCGAAMVYFLAREWFGDRRAALFAFAFYVSLPAQNLFSAGDERVDAGVSAGADVPHRSALQDTPTGGRSSPQACRSTGS